MSITLNFELNDRDLAHFTAAMDRSKKAAEGKTADEIIAASVALLDDAQKVHIPDFIKDRLLRLDDMIAMVRDQSWALPDTDKQRVLGALMYFCDPSDVIPDHVEVLGFLDDAVMIELSVRELKHEIEAYADFVEFRDSEARSRGADPAKVGRADWLEGRRAELQERMRKRRGGYGRAGTGSWFGVKTGD